MPRPAYVAPATTTPVRAPQPVGFVPQAPPPSRPPPTFTFTFQVGDELAVDVWKEKDLATTQRIQRDGTISPHVLGTVPVVGRTVEEVRQDLTERYSEYIKEPKVSVRIVSVHADRVFVLGEVRTPSAVPVVGSTSAMQAIAQAGGFNEEFAGKDRIRVIRAGPDGKPIVIAMNGESVLRGQAAPVMVQPGDVVYVPPSGLTNWARTLNQALGPISTFLGGAGVITSNVVAFRTLDQLNNQNTN
jgi:polysaccharide export outer membrane protein